MYNIFNRKTFKAKLVTKINLLLLAGSTLSTVNYSFAAERIGKITIEGNHRVEGIHSDCGTGHRSCRHSGNSLRRPGGA